MSAEATLRTALLAHAPLAALVGTRVFNEKYPPGTAYPLCVFQRITTEKIQPVTGVVMARSVRFQVVCYGEESLGSAPVITLAETVEDALVSAIGSFIDVTLGNEIAIWERDAKLYSQIIECECLEAA